MSANIDWAALVAAAARAQERAYAPYSDYQVGAAVLSGSGRVFAGCNVENATYALAICAERNAVAQMVAAGERTIAAVAVITKGPEAGTPCGLCRQTLAEFAEDAPIGLAVTGQDAPARIVRLADIFPEPFRGDLVKAP